MRLYQNHLLHAKLNGKDFTKGNLLCQGVSYLLHQLCPPPANTRDLRNTDVFETDALQIPAEKCYFAHQSTFERAVQVFTLLMYIFEESVMDGLFGAGQTLLQH